MTTDSKERTAYHEAGHAIMHVITEVAFDRVTVVPDEDYLGVVDWNRGPSIALQMNR